MILNNDESFLSLEDGWKSPASTQQENTTDCFFYQSGFIIEIHSAAVFLF